jgi:hypothetical protein
VAKLALAIRRGSSLFFSSSSLISLIFFLVSSQKWKEGLWGASWQNQQWGGGLSPGRPTAGFAISYVPEHIKDGTERRNSFEPDQRDRTITKN